MINSINNTQRKLALIDAKILKLPKHWLEELNYSSTQIKETRSQLNRDLLKLTEIKNNNLKHGRKRKIYDHLFIESIYAIISEIIESYPSILKSDLVLVKSTLFIKRKGKINTYEALLVNTLAMIAPDENYTEKEISYYFNVLREEYLKTIKQNPYHYNYQRE